MKKILNILSHVHHVHVHWILPHAHHVHAPVWIMQKKVLLSILCAGFLLLTLPFANKPLHGGRSGERQGQTGGIIRTYCEEPERFFLKGPQVHYGNNPFNLELTFFEWVQGKIAYAIDGPECDSVETVGKVFSSLVSVVGILALLFFVTHLWGWKSGLLSGLLLATDSLWLRYSTYTMIDTRVMTCALCALLFSAKRKPVLAFVFWSLTLLQRPQVFSFAAPFWFVLELRDYLKTKKIPPIGIIASVGCAAVIGYGYYLWSCKLNAESDLPWIQWMGPRVQKWFFGTWEERFSFIFFKNSALDWLRRSSLTIALPVLIVLWKTFLKPSIVLREILWRSLPYLLGMLSYTFVFHHVFIVHEHYALPLNVGFAFTTAGVIGFLFTKLWEKKSWKLDSILAGIALLGAVALPVVTSLNEHWKFYKDINNPHSPNLIQNWNIQIFPEKRKLVVIAGLESGRDLIALYNTKQRGFMWCAKNPQFAPRAFWKAHGVQYVAWAKVTDTGVLKWEVRTIDEELNFARKMGWLLNARDWGGERDAWSSRPMTEWAALGSRSGKDPCGDPSDFDPRKW